MHQGDEGLAMTAIARPVMLGLVLFAAAAGAAAGAAATRLTFLGACYCGDTRRGPRLNMWFPVTSPLVCTVHRRRTVRRRRRSFENLAWAAAIGLSAACNPASQTSDPYDPAKIDLAPKPAVVSSEPARGAYASGSALSTTATLKPLDTAATKEVRLDTVHKIIDIAPGVKFSAWTFGDQVPGPTIRVRVGDRVRFTMTNRSAEAIPGLRLTAAPMMHSMDFHAAMVSPQDKYRSIGPGQTIAFEFTANYPGVFMYHCGTPMILEHIASGMYGAVIVEPHGGYPTKADREYVIIQSEFYTKPDPDQRKADGVPLHVLDGDRLRSSQPTYTVFNGVHNGMVKRPLAAKPGERVRLYVLNVGPSKTSSFHVVGTIFDRVWFEGNPDNQFRGMQTVLLGSSNSAIVEFRIPENGAYIMVDHHSPTRRRAPSDSSPPPRSRRKPSSSITIFRPQRLRVNRRRSRVSSTSKASASRVIR
jgi:nitrite reductase (NO-forming)